MGWNGKVGAHYRTTEDRARAIREEIFTGENAEIVSLSTGRKDCYAAVKDKKTGLVRGYVILFSTTKENSAWKVMDETMHPFFYRCPRHVLDALSVPAPSEEAQKWRDGCRELKSKKNVYKQYRIVGRAPGRRSRMGILIRDGEVYRTKIRTATGFETESEAQQALDSVKRKLDGYGIKAWIDYA